MKKQLPCEFSRKAVLFVSSRCVVIVSLAAVAGEAVTTYETIALMLYFGMFVIALLNAKK